ncbi:GNAT family N-acetyltransferase [Halapricum sp. CBA1109]|uniref:GNAT family N-acetyltransferase n=1 Tax=Halapricum sp. CBA1109 TaxID=2668068 RepID=UPI0012F9DA63|nr:GNAT family protein [Halapricum sp. CBA1109]MUV89393.1 GNAT family N-acetyltransferase [Halapricum sp. CBA1109]
MPGGQFLTTDRLALRTVEEEDLPVLREYANDPVIRRRVTGGRPRNLEGQREQFEGMYDDVGDGVGLLACLDGEAVGYVRLFHVDMAARHATVEYWVRPAERRSGYGTEMVASVLTYAVEELRLHRVRARTAATNTASRRLLESLGFVHEGVQRAAAFVGGDPVDAHRYGLLEDEWEGR